MIYLTVREWNSHWFFNFHDGPTTYAKQTLICWLIRKRIFILPFSFFACRRASLYFHEVRSRIKSRNTQRYISSDNWEELTPRRPVICIGIRVRNVLHDYFTVTIVGVCVLFSFLLLIKSIQIAFMSLGPSIPTMYRRIFFTWQRKLQ